MIEAILVPSANRTFVQEQDSIGVLPALLVES
jgi:hypothetical protein